VRPFGRRAFLEECIIVATTKKKKKRRIYPEDVLKTILKILATALVVVCALIVVLYVVYKSTVKPPDQPDNPVVDIPITQPTDNPDTPKDESQGNLPQTVKMTRREDCYTFLLIGTDDGNGNADTIMVGTFDVKNSKISVLSIPRDTLVDVSRTVKKLNAAYGFGGINQVMNELEPILGFRPDHYIRVDIQAFVEVVDLLGPVDFYVPEDMHHNDGAGFIIDLKQGQQLLNGEQALQLVRYRGYQNADLGRIQTQQRFLTQLARQVLSWSTVTKVSELAQIFKSHFSTDLTVSELAWFGTQALSMDLSQSLTFATLPGTGDVTYRGVEWYYQLDPNGVINILNNTVNPYNEAIPSVLLDIFHPVG